LPKSLNERKSSIEKIIAGIICVGGIAENQVAATEEITNDIEDVSKNDCLPLEEA
jgi:hypothetical protein